MLGDCMTSYLSLGMICDIYSVPLYKKNLVCFMSKNYNYDALSKFANVFFFLINLCQYLSSISVHLSVVLPLPFFISLPVCVCLFFCISPSVYFCLSFHLSISLFLFAFRFSAVEIFTYLHIIFSILIQWLSVFILIHHYIFDDPLLCNDSLCQQISNKRLV